MFIASTHTVLASAVFGLFAQEAATEPTGSWWSATASWFAAGGPWFLAILLLVACGAAWLLNLVALPGNWIAILLMGLYAWLGPEQGVVQLGVASLATAFALGLIGEGIEFAAGALGASRAGASRRATVAAIVGSVVGAITGGLVGMPIPVFGPIVAAIVFGGLGATAGAMLAEWNRGRPWQENWKIGQAAFWGRTAGTVGKMIAGLGILVVCAVALLI